MDLGWGGGRGQEEEGIASCTGKEEEEEEKEIWENPRGFPHKGERQEQRLCPETGGVNTGGSKKLGTVKSCC